VGEVRGDILKLVEVSSGYNGRPVLVDVSLTVSEGERVAVIGPNGSGKSTLLKTVLRLVEIYRGSIIFQGVDIARLPKGELPGVRARMGYVPQEGVLFPHLRVIDNVALPLRLALGMGKAEAYRRALEYLRLFDVHGLADRYPAQLSGGQRQRVAIVRALALEPQVLLLDEPTANLDPTSRADVMEVLREVAKLGKAMVLVTHELEFAGRVAGRVVAMSAGRVVYDGPLDADAVRRVYGDVELRYCGSRV
jgi:polar amino acid transport system ATP-binding protein